MGNIKKTKARDGFSIYLFERFKSTFDIILASFLGVFWCIYATMYGLGFTPDSIRYMTIALRMHHNLNFSIDPVIPPLYPILINLFMFIKKFPADAALLLSCISMFLILLVFILILRKFSNEILLNSLFLLTSFTLSAFIQPYLMVWSEPVFSLFAILTVYFVIMHLDTKKIKYYIFASLAVSFASITRYMGYSLIGAFFIYTIYFMFIYSKGSDISKKRYFLWNSVSYFPVIIYVTSNFLVFETFHGTRPPSSTTSFFNISLTFDVIRKDLNIYLLILLVSALVMFIFSLKTEKRKVPLSKIEISLSFILCFILIYLAMVIYTTSSVMIDPINPRYFSSIYPILFLFIFICFKNMLNDDKWDNLFTHLVRMAIYGFLIAALFANVIPFGKLLNYVSGQQYEKKSSHLQSGFDHSKTAEEFNEFFKDFFTNHDKLYVGVLHPFQIGKGNAQKIPRKNGIREARAFFFRKRILENPKFSHFSFENVTDRFFGITDYNVTFQAKNKKKSILYYDLLYLSKRQYMAKIQDIIIKEKIDSFFLIVFYPQRPFGLNNCFLTKSLKIEASIPIGYSIVYQLKKKDSPGHKTAKGKGKHPNGTREQVIEF